MLLVLDVRAVWCNSSFLCLAQFVMLYTVLSTVVQILSIGVIRCCYCLCRKLSLWLELFMTCCSSSLSSLLCWTLYLVSSLIHLLILEVRSSRRSWYSRILASFVVSMKFNVLRLGCDQDVCRHWSVVLSVSAQNVCSPHQSSSSWLSKNLCHFILFDLSRFCENIINLLNSSL